MKLLAVGRFGRWIRGKRGVAASFQSVLIGTKISQNCTSSYSIESVVLVLGTSLIYAGIAVSAVSVAV